jgi:perosamine synthetase
LIANPPSQPQTDPRTSEAYMAAIRRHFGDLKGIRRYDELIVKSIPIGDGEGYMVPFCELHMENEELIAQLASWRDAHQHVYPTRFKVTIEGTKRWLRAILDNEGRIMFLLLDAQGRPVGHLGWTNAVHPDRLLECDNWVRGVKDSTPGLFAKAVKRLHEWAEEMFGPEKIILRVMTSNTKAIEFHKKRGYVLDWQEPLREHRDAEGNVSLRYLEPGDDAPPDDSYDVMAYHPNRDDVGQETILTAGPTISSLEMGYTFDAARNGWNREWSRYLTQFEREFAEYLGVKHALATSSGTGALHLALLALGIGPGDEVIVPDVTWVATGNAVVYVGATPVFADVQPDSWCMDPDSFESLITERTKAVMPVHLYGHPAEMDRIMEIARRHNLHVVEDAAPAIGTEFRGRKTGTFGDFAMFSFQGAKLAVTGEGGMLVTDDDALYERVHALWDQGRTPGTFWINEIGWKYKMSNIQAALGLGQLQRIDELITRKRDIFGWYAEGLEGVRGITLNHESEWARSICWMTSILVSEEAGIGRDELRERLKAMNVDTRPVFPAISRYPIWPRPQAPQPNALRIGETGINLPSGHKLRRHEVAYVCDCIRKVVNG